MKQEWIDAYLDVHWDEMVEAMKTLMRIPSVSGEAEGEYPFGKNCADVLDAALEMGRKIGMDIQNDDYYGGSILMPGEKPEEIGIFAHLDVVPEGTGWIRPPYAPYVRDNWLFGRGGADDKGAAVLALYAMDCVKQSGVLPKRTVRLYLGCSEECGMKDISAYLERHAPPAFSFVPDASFSVCYAEKGICELELSADAPRKLSRYDAGTVSNAVAGLARADFAGQAPAFDEKRWPHVCVMQNEKGFTVEAAGRSSHAAFPETSVNASAMLAEFIIENGLVDSEDEKTLRFLSECFRPFYGEKLGIAFETPEMGKLTAIGGTTRMKNGRLIQNVNIRYPKGVDKEWIERHVTQTAKAYGWTMCSIKDDPPSYISSDNPTIQALNALSTKYVGETGGPYCMGGGTYARHLPRAVAFGPGIRGLKKPCEPGHGGGHQPDECVSLELLRKAFYVYAEAILKIDETLDSGVFETHPPERFL